MKSSIDSSGIILLAKSGILREVCSLTELETSEDVRSEVMAGLEKGRKDALYMQELVKEGKIKITAFDKKLCEKFRKDFNLGMGEASVIALSATKKMPMITDDNKARKVGKVIGLDVLSSLDFPVILYKKGMITSEKARNCLEILKKEGWFGESVLIEAFNALKRGEKE